MSAEGVTGWIATFRDGPLADHQHDRVFAVGDPWREIRLAPLPSATRGPHYEIVGGDGIPRDAGDEPWGGEVTYRLAEVIPLAGMHGEPVAYYDLAEVQFSHPEEGT